MTHRGSIGSLLLQGLQMSHLTQGSNREKLTNTSQGGAWAPRETQQSGVGARSRVIPLLLPSAGSASILLAWQQPLPPLTHTPSAAVLGFTPASSHRLRATRGAVLEMLSAGAAGSHSLALHRKQQHCRITFRLSQLILVRKPVYPTRLENEIFSHLF